MIKYQLVQRVFPKVAFAILLSVIITLTVGCSSGAKTNVKSSIPLQTSSASPEPTVSMSALLNSVTPSTTTPSSTQNATNKEKKASYLVLGNDKVFFNGEKYIPNEWKQGEVLPFPNESKLKFVTLKEISDTKSELIKISCSWDTQKVKPQVLTGNFTDKQKKAVEDTLIQNGLNNTPVVITSVYKVDLDQDGSVEEIITATNLVLTATLPNPVADISTLKTKEKLGYYKMILVIKQEKKYPVYEEYHPITLDDLRFRTNDELGFIGEEQPRCYIDYHTYYFNNSGSLSLYNGYFVDEGGEGTFMGGDGKIRVLNIIDVDGDGMLEIISGNQSGFGPFYTIHKLDNVGVEEVFKLSEYRP